LEETYKLYKENERLSAEDYFNLLNHRVGTNVNDLQTFMVLFYVARMFNVQGYSLFVSNACASGLYAIEAASQCIKAGRNKIMVVASSEHPAIYKYLWFERLGLLSPSGVIKPFDKCRDGFICGEGAAAIVLEDYEHAVKRNAKIYAEYAGGGFNLENWKRTLPCVDYDYRAKAIREALKNSALNAEDIKVVSLHGLGSQVIDRIESTAIRNIFEKNQPYVTAYKPYVGHTLGNCALIETIFLLMNMQNNFLSPVLNLEQLDPDINLNVVRRDIDLDFNTVLKTIWGFGGFNAACVFRKKVDLC
jgi:3-oxoacyl-(acyl-carrier-protein) synthase